MIPAHRTAVLVNEVTGMTDELISIGALAARAEVSTDTLRRWIAEERIDLIKKGDRRRRFIRSADAERLLAPRIVNHGETRDAAKASA